MKNHLPGYIAAAFLGVAAGWAIGASRRSPEPAPPLRSVPPAPETPAARPATAAPPVDASEPPPAPPPAAPAKSGPTAAVPVPPPEWIAKIRSAARVKDLLGMEMPPGDPILQRNCFYARNHQIRELLKNETSQAAFLSDLPAMSQKELVALWDVFWLTEREQAGGFRQYGTGFARTLSRSLVELVSAQTDPSLRQLEATLLLPDTRYLNDRELDHLRNFLQACDDPFLKKKAAEIPDRGTR